VILVLHILLLPLLEEGVKGKVKRKVKKGKERERQERQRGQERQEKQEKDPSIIKCSSTPHVKREVIYITELPQKLGRH